MGKEEKKLMRRRLANAYLSSVVSISLVLLLIGVASLLILNAKSVSDYFKENLQLSVLLKQEVSQSKAEAYEETLRTLPYIKGTRLVSREEGTEEMKAMLGEDFLSVFETSPIPISIELTLKAEYVEPDSLEVVSAVIAASPLVDEVNCQQSLVQALNANLAKISLFLGVFILLMLFISFVLINNTVRLSVYSRRFTIHTMKLVGATRPFIRGPFLAGAVYQGLVSSGLAIALLAAILLLLRREFGQLVGIFEPRMLLATAGIMVLGGVLICLASTYFVVNKLVSLQKDDLYY